MDPRPASGEALKDLAYRLSTRLPLASVQRYILALIFYSTPRKLANLLRCEIAKRRRHVEATAYPFVLAFDTANSCNLRCPYCLTGQGRIAARGRELNLDLLDQLLDEVSPYLLLGNLGNWGEPLLSPNVAEAVRRLHSRRIFTTISSNMSFQHDDRLKAVCDAGLDYLIVSADGATQPVYEQYRRRGRLDQVIRNIALVLDHRRSSGKSTPIVEWQFVRFRHNACEVEIARRLAADLGVDTFRMVPGVAPAEDEVPSDEPFQPRARDTYCEQLWHTVILNVDGGVAPCCYLHGKQEDFGRIQDRSLADIRQGARYREGRTLFSRSPDAAQRVERGHPCLTCEVFTHRTLAPDPKAIIGRRFIGDRIGPLTS